jgi:hypothetical protein
VVIFLALLMTVAVFALVSYPLLRPGRGEADLVATNHRGTEDLLAQRDAAYAAIKELEFEFHLGNLSQRDYEDLRAHYRHRAADILRRLDAAEREAGGARNGGRALCPTCHAPAQPGDRFCGHCGIRLQMGPARGERHA